MDRGNSWRGGFGRWATDAELHPEVRARPAENVRPKTRCIRLFGRRPVLRCRWFPFKRRSAAQKARVHSDGRLLFLGILALLASVAVIVGTVVFLIWAAQYFGRRAYRQRTRLHLYVPVAARVTRVIYHFQAQATLYVEYEFGGTQIANRFTTIRDVAQLAQQSKQIALLIDPDHPRDVIVDPGFDARASATPKPQGWGTARSDFLLRVRAPAARVPRAGRMPAPRPNVAEARGGRSMVARGVGCPSPLPVRRLPPPRGSALQGIAGGSPGSFGR
jgi:hypothetical protein